MDGLKSTAGCVVGGFLEPKGGQQFTDAVNTGSPALGWTAVPIKTTSTRHSFVIPIMPSPFGLRKHPRLVSPTVIRQKSVEHSEADCLVSLSRVGFRY